MRFRLGALIGFGAGYYLGAKAGRERYEQINRWLDEVRESGPAQAARNSFDEGVAKARARVDDAGPTFRGDISPN